METIKIKEIKEGIKRLYLKDSDLSELKGQPGEDRGVALKMYLNKEFKLGIKEILDIVMCEERFAHHIYYMTD